MFTKLYASEKSAYETNAHASLAPPSRPPGIENIATSSARSGMGPKSR
jgi:hypothetical protein